MQGRYLKISPIPDADSDEGIKLIYVPILSMSSDAEVPPIPVSLHFGIVMAAQLVAYGDTAEVSDKEAVTKELDRFIGLNVVEHESNADGDEFLTFSSNLRITAADYE